MVRLSDMLEVEAAHLVAKECAPFAKRPWVEGPPLPERRVALVTSDGLHRVGDPAFSTVDLSYRLISGTISTSELTMTHSSVHFDRTGFREDVNVVFPLDRLREVEAEGAIGWTAQVPVGPVRAGTAVRRAPRAGLPAPRPACRARVAGAAGRPRHPGGLPRRRSRRRR